MLGKWIDSLTDAERDRIIEHPDPTFNGSQWWNDWTEGRDCGCLVGCVVGKEIASRWVGIVREHSLPPREIGALGFYTGLRFPDLTHRFGAPRMWRLVKARAARGNAPSPVQEREEVTVG